MTIYLCEILPVFAQVSAQKKYKLHFAQKGKDPVSGQDTEQPLDVFVRSRDDWQGWHEHRPIRNDFNRSFIFALAHFHPYKNLGKKVWLFGVSMASLNALRPLRS